MGPLPLLMGSDKSRQKYKLTTLWAPRIWITSMGRGLERIGDGAAERHDKSTGKIELFLFF